MALISLGDWIDRYGDDETGDVEGIVEPATRVFYPVSVGPSPVLGPHGFAWSAAGAGLALSGRFNAGSGTPVGRHSS
jgi:hypothetical protein